MMHSIQVGIVRHEMKQRIKHGIPEGERVVIKITPEIENNAEVFTRIHSREFRYLGEMYDVLSFVDLGDSTVYTCIHDVKESGLFKNLDNLVKQQLNSTTPDKERRELSLGFFTQHYLPLVDMKVEVSEIQVSLEYFFKIFPSGGHSPGLLRPPIC